MTTELSPRQEQILKMILAGYDTKDICRLLNLSDRTVYTYKKIIMEKWEVESMVELIMESIRRGYLDMEEDDLAPKSLVYSTTTLSYDTFVYYAKRKRMYSYLIRD